MELPLPQYRYGFGATDYGASWTEANMGMSNANVVGLEIIGSYVFARTEYNGIYRSTNGGASWSLANSGLPNLNVRSIGTDGGK